MSNQTLGSSKREMATSSDQSTKKCTPVRTDPAVLPDLTHFVPQRGFFEGNLGGSSSPSPSTWNNNRVRSSLFFSTLLHKFFVQQVLYFLHTCNPIPILPSWGRHFSQVKDAPPPPQSNAKFNCPRRYWCPFLQLCYPFAFIHLSVFFFLLGTYNLCTFIPTV